MILWVVVGFGIALLCAFLLHLLSIKQYPFWRVGLVIAALIYVGFALFGQNWEWLPIELLGVLIYGVFFWLSKYISPYFIAAGWALHVLWDIFLHPGGHPGYVPTWYPPICLGFDLFMAIYLVYLIRQFQKTSTSTK